VVKIAISGQKSSEKRQFALLMDTLQPFGRRMRAVPGLHKVSVSDRGQRRTTTAVNHRSAIRGSDTMSAVLM